MNKSIYLVILILFCSLSYQCTNFEDETQESEVANEYPDQESWDAKMFFTKESKRRAILNAGYVAKYSSKKYTLLKENVKVDFYNEEGEHTSVLTSNEGKVFDDRQDLIAIGDVIVVSDKGSRLYSEELIWDNKQQKMISNVPVKITTETDTLFGDTFKSDPDLVNYEITNAHGSSQQKISIDE